MTLYKKQKPKPLEKHKIMKVIPNFYHKDNSSETENTWISFSKQFIYTSLFYHVDRNVYKIKINKILKYHFKSKISIKF